MTALTHDQLPTYRPAGQHRWPKGGAVDHLGRKLIADPVPADYWPEGVPATRTTDTAVLDTEQVRRRADTEPATRTDVLAELRGDLDAQAQTDVAEIFAEVTGKPAPPTAALAEQVINDGGQW